MVAPDALPPANVGKVGDTFLAADGRSTGPAASAPGAEGLGGR